jgi:hypothetical protein
VVKGWRRTWAPGFASRTTLTQTDRVWLDVPREFCSVFVQFTFSALLADGGIGDLGSGHHRCDIDHLAERNATTSNNVQHHLSLVPAHCIRVNA